MRLVLLFGLIALLLAGCVQQTAPQASPSPSPSAMPSPLTCVFKDNLCCKGSACKTLDTECPAGYEKTITGECTANCAAVVICEPTPTPEVLPSPSPQAPSIENLTQLRDVVDDALRKTFSTSPSWFESGDGKVLSATTTSGKFSYALFLRRSPYNAWSAFDTIVTRQGLSSNKTKSFSLSLDLGAVGVKTYDAKMECFNWTFLIEYKIRELTPDQNAPQNQLAENLTARLVDVCP